jgi:hypothetical protein
MPITRSRPTLCPACGKTLDAHGTFPGDDAPAPPVAGDWTICGGCARILQFEDGAMRVVTQDELAALSSEDRAQLAAQQALVRRFFLRQDPTTPH